MRHFRHITKLFIFLILTYLLMSVFVLKTLLTYITLTNISSLVGKDILPLTTRQTSLAVWLFFFLKEIQILFYFIILLLKIEKCVQKLLIKTYPYDWIRRVEDPICTQRSHIHYNWSWNQSTHCIFFSH